MARKPLASSLNNHPDRRKSAESANKEKDQTPAQEEDNGHHEAKERMNGNASCPDTSPSSSNAHSRRPSITSGLGLKTKALTEEAKRSLPTRPSSQFKNSPSSQQIQVLQKSREEEKKRVS